MSRNLSRFLFVSVAFMFVILFSSSSNAATTINVTKIGGLIDAINRVNNEGGVVDINLAAGTYTLSGSELAIMFKPGAPGGLVRMIGAGRDATMIDGGGASRVFNFNLGSNRELVLQDLTVRNGNAGTGDGGGIYQNGGHLTLSNVVIRSNTAANGGGIYSTGANLSGQMLELQNSTVSDNTASAYSGGGLALNSMRFILDKSTVNNNSAGSGGGIVINRTIWGKITNSTIHHNTAGMLPGISSYGSTLYIENSTISNNTGGVAAASGGIYVSASTVNVASSTITGNHSDASSTSGAGVYIVSSGSFFTMKNSILAYNTNGSGRTPSDCYGTITSEGYNLIGDTKDCTITEAVGDIKNTLALIGPLADNGGPTMTHLPLGGSPAIDGGDTYWCANGRDEPLTTDQRGFLRKAAATPDGTARCDIGSVEVTQCGDGIVQTERGETCDIAIAAGTAGACPILAICDDGSPGTTDTLDSSGTCQATCVHTSVTACTYDDNYCPYDYCDSFTDNDCSPRCGNGVVEGDETCDTGIIAGIGACPVSCNDSNACTIDTMLESNCHARCNHPPVEECTGGDGCCADGCNSNNDSDCSPDCGNGVKEAGENCDTGIAAGDEACPASCNDDNVCTTDTTIGSGCQTTCEHTTITQCVLVNDGCCPAGCNNRNDGDCLPSCGNGVVEAGETCDTGMPDGARGLCPTRAGCNDGDRGTTDTLNSPGTCQAACVHTAITECIHNDDYCPAGCTNSNDSDCPPPDSQGGGGGTGGDGDDGSAGGTGGEGDGTGGSGGASSENGGGTGGSGGASSENGGGTGGSSDGGTGSTGGASDNVGVGGGGGGGGCSMISASAPGAVGLFGFVIPLAIFAARRVVNRSRSGFCL